MPLEVLSAVYFKEHCGHTETVMEKCISWESNPGYIDGTNVFYHWTTEAPAQSGGASDTENSLFSPIL